MEGLWCKDIEPFVILQLFQVKSFRVDLDLLLE